MKHREKRENRSGNSGDSRTGESLKTPVHILAAFIFGLFFE